MGVLNRIDPNNDQQMVLILLAASGELLFEFKPKDFDFLAAKIEPNCVVGSYVVTLLASEDLLSDEARELIRERVDVSKISFTNPESELGTTLGNLLEVGLVEINVPKSPVLSLDALIRQLGAFNSLSNSKNQLVVVLGAF